MKLNKRLLLVVKILVLLTIVALVGWQLADTWHQLEHTKLHVDWRFGVLGVLSFAGVFVSSGVVWRWLAWKMGDRSPTVPILGAYIFSQVGKYVPGKVMLLIMRIERTRRFGMDATTCTVSTLVENAMYMVSGGLATAVTLLLYVHDHPAYIAGVAIMIVAMLGAFYPPVFYRLVNGMLTRMKRAPVAPEQQLPLRTLLLAVAMFMPCWLCGGLALWSAARCITPLALAQGVTFPGAFAFSVISGMVMALTPGGLGTREAVLALFLAPVLSPPVAGIVAVLQRLFQILSEAALGGVGALLTAGRSAAQTDASASEERQTGAPSDGSARPARIQR